MLGEKFAGIIFCISEIEMIPKKIHYCWFGHNQLPESAKKCINSWKKFCPSFDIIEWNEENFNIDACPQYVKDAYSQKKWAFVTDYVRLKVVYENGGIYFDTDVELISRIDSLLKYNAYFGFEDGVYVNTGLGFGAVKGMGIIKEMMDVYTTLPFILEDGTMNQETCPVINTKTLGNHGLKQNNKSQTIENNIRVLSSKYMCPIDFETGILKKSRRTISIHWFDSSWMSQADKDYHEKHRKAIRAERRDYWRHIPNRMLSKLLGKKLYANLKGAIKR